ncbi:MAG TPA: hypothetical protein VF844_10090 [Ktedonobacteraceae bacterium]
MSFMILHLGERVYWGAPEVIYLEGTITRLDEESQAVLVHIDRATPNSAHLIGADMSFAADGLAPLQGESPDGITSERSLGQQPAGRMSDDEKVRCAAAVAVYQKYGNTIRAQQKEAMIEQVMQILNSDPEMRARIIASMDQLLLRVK